MTKIQVSIFLLPIHCPGLIGRSSADYAGMWQWTKFDWLWPDQGVSQVRPEMIGSRNQSYTFWIGWQISLNSWFQTKGFESLEIIDLKCSFFFSFNRLTGTSLIIIYPILYITYVINTPVTYSAYVSGCCCFTFLYDLQWLNECFHFLFCSLFCLSGRKSVQPKNMVSSIKF